MRPTKLKTIALVALLTSLGATAWAQEPGTGTTTDDPATTTTPGTGTTATPGTGTTGTTDTTGTTGTTDRTGTTGTSTMDDDDMLPATATPLWLLGVLNGAALMGFAAGLRAYRRRA
jgi:hypothetical protein